MVAKLWQIIRNNKAKAFIYKQIFHSKVLLKQRPKQVFNFSATNSLRDDCCLLLQPYFLQLQYISNLKFPARQLTNARHTQV